MHLQWTGQLVTGHDALDVDLRDITISSIGGHTFLYTSTGVNGGLTAYELSETGDLAQLTDQEFFNGQTGSAAAGLVEVLQLDGQSHLVFGSGPNDGLMAFSLREDGTIASAAEITAASTSVGQVGAMAMASGADGLRLFLIDDETGALSIHTLPLGVSGQSTNSQNTNVQNTAITFGTGAQIETVTVGGSSFLLATDQTSNSVFSYQISADTGALSQVGFSGAPQGLGISLPTAMETVTAFGQSWIVLGSAGSSSISVMRLTAEGALEPMDHIIDTLHTRFDALTTLTVAQDGDRVFVIAGGSDDGLSMFTLAPDGRLIHLQTLQHFSDAGLQNVTQLSASVVGDEIQIFAASGVTSGLTQLNIDLDQVTDAQIAGIGAHSLSGGAGEDMLVGSDIGFDTLAGGAGDDILISGAAGGRLTGGTGADLFVLHADAITTTITDFAPGVDQIDMSDFPFLRTVDQLTVQPMGWGARITFRDATINVYSASGDPLDVTDLFGAGFTGADRILLLTPDAGQVVLGTNLDDSLYGTPNNDTLRGLDADDLIEALDGDDTVEGGDGADLAFGGNGNDVLDMGDGDDQGWGGAGDDLVIGGLGNDTLGGSRGNDTIETGAGDDEAWAGADADLMTGGTGNDILGGGTGDDTIWGEDDDDVMWGGRNNDRVNGGNGNDVVGGGPGKDLLWGEAGNDTFWAHTGNDTIWGGNGNDLIGAGTDNDLAYGEAGHDELRLGKGNDTGYGGAGDDTILGANGNDLLLGGSGNDVLEGGNGADTLLGENDHDVLTGGEGDDSLSGGNGNDTMWAGIGNDTLVGGTGDDTLVGEAGADSFVFLANQGNDVIREFETGVDVISIGSGASSFDSLNMSQSGSDVLITLGSGTIRLEGLSLQSLSADDFSFF